MREHKPAGPSARAEGEGGNPGVDTSVSAVLSFYPPTEFGHPDKLSGAVSMLMGTNSSPGAVRNARPLTCAARDFPPTVFFHGNADEIVPVEASLSMYRALTAAGATAELHIYSDQPHAFDGPAAFGRQCAEIMALFLKRYAVSAAPALVAAAAP